MKVTGSNITIDDSVVNKMNILPLGNCEQDTYTGKNKYDVGQLSTITDSGITFTPLYENGLLQYININGTATANTFYQLKKITLSAGNYILNGCIGGSTNTYQIGINFGGSRINGVDGDISFTLSEEKTMTESFIRIANGTAANNIKIYPMIRLATVTDDTYEPYTGGIPSPNPSYPQDIKVVTGNNSVVVCNENLLDLSNITEGYLVQTNGNLVANTSYGASDYIPVKANQSYCQNSTNTYYGAFYDTSKNYVSAIQNQVVITPAVDGYVRVSFLLTNKDSVSVNKGTTPITYIQGKSQTATLTLGSLYLGGIGDNRDYINPDTKKKIGVIDYVVLDGDEEFAKDDENNVFTISKDDLGIELAENSLNIISNQYIFQNTTPIVTGQAQVGETDLILKFDDGTTSLADFKTWLSSNNLVLYYVLEQPFESTITDATLVAELEDLNNMRSYDGTTNITATSEDTNAQMEVEITYTSESDMIDKLLDIFDRIKSKLYHIIRSL